MDPSLSGAKLLSALVLDTISISIRGFATTSQGAVTTRSGGAATTRMGKAAKEDVGHSAENSWVLDPVIGYYKPTNKSKEIEGTALREMLLKQRSHRTRIVKDKGSSPS